ncbi:MAG: SHOCT domain-containing protein [Candidatus Nealsonbacteria bacterium]
MKKRIIFTLALLFSLPVSVSAHTADSEDSGFTHMMGDYMSGGFCGVSSWGWIGPILMIIFWALVILGAVFFAKWLTGQFRDGKGKKSAIDILEERYAKGEINKEEFENKKKDLS